MYTLHNYTEISSFEIFIITFVIQYSVRNTIPNSL